MTVNELNNKIKTEIASNGTKSITGTSLQNILINMVNTLSGNDYIEVRDVMHINYAMTEEGTEFSITWKYPYYQSFMQYGVMLHVLSNMNYAYCLYKKYSVQNNEVEPTVVFSGGYSLRGTIVQMLMICIKM